jgi:hypothetical protein
LSNFVRDRLKSAPEPRAGLYSRDFTSNASRRYSPIAARRLAVDRRWSSKTKFDNNKWKIVIRQDRKIVAGKDVVSGIIEIFLDDSQSIKLVRHRGRAAVRQASLSSICEKELIA